MGTPVAPLYCSLSHNAQNLLRLVGDPRGLPHIRNRRRFALLQHAVLLRLLPARVSLDEGSDHFRLSPGGAVDPVDRPRARPALQPAQAHPGGHGVHLRGIPGLRNHARLANGLLRAVVPLHGRLHSLRADPASARHLALVPAQSRQGHGDSVRGRRPHRIPRLVPGETVDRGNQLPHGPRGVGRADASGVAAGPLRDPRPRRGQGPLPRWRQPTARRKPGGIVELQLSAPSLFVLAAIDRQLLLHRRDRRGELPHEVHGAIGAVNFHMKFVFLDQGFTDHTKEGLALLNSTWRVASMTILATSIAGRLAIGGLADRFSKKWVMTATYFLVAATIPMLLTVSPSRSPVAFAVLFGFGMGADYMLIPLMAAEQFGVNTLARAMAIILPVNTIGQTWFPYFVSILHERFGSYAIALRAVFAVSVIGALASLLLPRHPAQDEAFRLQNSGRIAARG